MGSLAAQGKGKLGGRAPQPKHAIANCCCYLAKRKEAIPSVAELLCSRFTVGDICAVTPVSCMIPYGMLLSLFLC